MAHLNTAQLIKEATDLSHRAYQVQQDPAVQKAWGDAGSDLAKARTSLGTAFSETLAAWRRVGPTGDSGSADLYA